MKDKTAEKIKLNKKPKRLQHWNLIAVCLVVYDMVAVSAAYFAALMLRFDMRFSMIPEMYYGPWLRFAPYYAVYCVIIFWALRLYKSIWRFASITELERIIIATLITTVVHAGVITIVMQRMPISYYLIGAILQFILIVGVRFAYRFILLLRASRRKDTRDRVLLVGAGSAGQMILRDIKRAGGVKEKVVCIIDDNPNKWNRDVEGVPVVGGRESIPEAVREFDVDKIYVAIPSASATERRDILDICKETDCELMNLPGMYQLMLGDVSVSSLKKVDVEDLLGREPVKMGGDEVREFLTGKSVLITGGGGSIGSELARQVAAIKELRQLIIFDIYENNAHAIKLELMDKYPDLDLVVLIGSVRNSRRLRNVFETYHPDIVFHAAAHKHVPLMEDSPNEAIKNNVLGTYYTAYMAMTYKCEKFVLISTDKAVNPVNIMGASKRLCEMIIQTFAHYISDNRASELPDLQIFKMITGIRELIEIPKNPKTQFTAVRFGNVLGSNGSVIPRFREQIATGGPVTVTHPDIIRYFMTIPEAASLVLQAAAFGADGRIFVLDMGTPVKIDDLARNMIRLSGMKPEEDIKIVYTGLRPGEKLFEERLMDEEGLQTTKNELINIGSPILFDEELFLKQLQDLAKAAYEDKDNIRSIVANIVPTYEPAGEHGTDKKNEVYLEQIKSIEQRNN